MPFFVLTNEPDLPLNGRVWSVLGYLWHAFGLIIVAVLASWVSWDTWRFWALPEGRVLVSATLLAYILALMSTRRLMGIVPTGAVVTTLVSVSMIFLLLVLLLAFGRFYYSRSFLLIAFLGTFVWQWLGWRFLSKPQPKIGLIPGGLTKNLEKLPGVNWILLDKSASITGLDAVAVDLHTTLDAQWIRFLAECSLRRIPLYHAAAVHESLTGKASLPHHSEELMEAIQLPPFYPILKRLLDVTVVLLSLPILLPLLLLIALLIRLDSPGPILFIQERIGQGGKPFGMIKFRTMYKDADNVGAQFAKSGDRRITRVGKWLRKFRMDELPQLWNVLRGEMSVIGPRPEQVPFAKQFEEEIPFYAYRHLVKPGITGWAQVTQGYAADTDETRDKLAYDLYYIKNLSLWLDSLIVFKTIRTILTGFGAR